MLSISDLNNNTDRVAWMYQAMSDELFLSIAKRLRPHSMDEVNLLRWQIEALSDLGMFTSQTVDELAKATGRTAKQIEDILTKNAEEVITDTDKQLKQAGYAVKPSPDIQAIAKAFVDQAMGDIDNLVNQTLISKSLGSTVARTYQQVVSDTSVRFSSGMMTFDGALMKSLTELAEKGLPSDFRDRSGRRWNIQNYTRTVLKTTNSRMYNELRTSRAQEHGVYTMLVTSKPDARPACLPIQGKVVDVRPPEEAISGYPSIYSHGYPKPGGHRGVNCGHDWILFIPGISENNQRQYDAKEVVKNTAILNRRNDLANRIRKTKRNLKLAEEIGSEKYDHYKALLARQQADMRRFVAENNLKRHYQLEKVYIH